MEKIKKVLIYLYEKFNGSQEAVWKELLEKKLTFNSVEEFEKELSKINVNAYITFLDDDYPEKYKSSDMSKVPLVIKK